MTALPTSATVAAARTCWDDGLPRARPITKGVDAAAITALLDDAAAQHIELDSFMLWHDGAVIAEGWWWPYRADRPHMMHSATKSFLSAAVGCAIAEGRFALSDSVISFFPDKVSADPASRLARMTIEDLLTQTSGHARGMSGGKWRSITTSWIDEFLAIAVAFEPGTKFTYSSATSYMLSAIISRTTGMTAHAYLTPRLLEPLGIAGLSWDIGPEGINSGGNGISCRTADLLKLAILHVQRGEWRGVQLLPRAWTDAATTPQRGNQHGYHWWTGPDRSFYAYGVFGQFAWAYPEQRGILVVTAAVPGHEEALRALAARHLPGILMSEPVADTPVSTSALIERCADLRLLPRLDASASPLEQAVSGRTYAAAANADDVAYFRLDLEQRRASFRLGDVRGEHVIRVGLDDWIESDTTMSGSRLHHGYEPTSMRVVAGGRWIAPEVFEMTWQFVETAFRDTVTLRFDGECATLDRGVNVNTFPTQRPTIRAVRMQDDVPASYAALVAAARRVGDTLSQTTSVRQAAYSTATTTVGDLLDTPATKTVLQAIAPFLLRNPRIDEARHYTLPEIVQYVPELTADILATLDASLADIAAIHAPNALPEGWP